ncbi:MAG: glutamyl-tRNA reductase [Epsilonproteobacteria bacterium]|nr:glutamyl-tRNA reductase [Campylobacterota bacterium]
MHYLIISFSHKNSTLIQREKLAFVDDAAKIAMMEKINYHPHISESMILSTCNRIEIFCSCTHIEEASDYLLSLLSAHSHFALDELKMRGDILDDYGAIHHLFSVASSLDSMVVGETQIAGQIKDAFKLALEHDLCGLKISRAMQFAQKCAAEIRNATEISSKPVSVASVAVSKARECCGSLEGMRALVIGSGEMSMITCKHLSAQGVDVTIMNRTFSKAEEIANECKAKVRSFEELAGAVNEYELLFTATGSISPIIDEEMIETCSFDRYWFDMAVPRDIEYENGSFGIHVYRIDDLKEIVSTNIALREDEARTSFVIVGRQSAAFFEWLKALTIEPLIKTMYEAAYRCALTETKRVVEKGFVPKEHEAAVQKATEQALKRFLHPFSQRMRDASDPLRADSLIGAMSFLINENDDQTPPTQKSYKGS